MGEDNTNYSGSWTSKVVTFLRSCPIVRNMMAEPLRFKLSDHELILAAAYLGGRQLRGIPDAFATASEESARKAWSDALVSFQAKGYGEVDGQGKLVLDANLADALRSSGSPLRSLNVVRVAPGQSDSHFFFNAANRRFASIVPCDSEYRISLYPSSTAAAAELVEFVAVKDAVPSEIGTMHRSGIAALKAAIATEDAAAIERLSAKLKSPEKFVGCLRVSAGTVLLEMLTYDSAGALLRQDTQEIIISGEASLRLSVLRHGDDPLYRISSFNSGRLRSEAESFLVG
jgi:hypothetical protein